MQEENKRKKYEQDNTLPAIPYKMKEFENVQAKIKTVNPIKLHPKQQKADYNSLDDKKINDFFERENSSRLENKVQKNHASESIGNLVNAMKSQSQPQNEEYKIFSKNDYVLSHYVSPDADIYAEEKQIKKQNTSNKLKTDNIVSVPKRSSTKPKTSSNAQKPSLLNQRVVNKSLEKTKIKGPTPKANEFNTLLPKKNVNHIKENKTKITNDQVPNRAKELKKELEPVEHKNYGKVPDYINKFKQEIEDKKEEERRKAEEAKFPKGTRLLSEDERLAMLNDLNMTKKEVETALFKLPITLRTLSMQNRKAELENKLNELDSAISQFSKKKVFIKSDE